MSREQYLARRNELLALAQRALDAQNMDEYKAHYASIETLDAEYEAQAQARANLNALQNKASGISAEQFVLNGGLQNTWTTPAEMYNSEEYRTAFMKNTLAGTPIPEKFRNTTEQATTTGEVLTVIPTVLIQKIQSKLETVGKFYNMVTKTSYKGGVEIPVSNVKLEAEWVSERSQSDTQDAPMGTSIVFTYHKLTCRVAVSFEVDTVTLDIFEAHFVEKVSEAMIKKLEGSIFNGTGSGQPKGFLTETPADGQTIEITEGNHITYADLTAAEGALPEEYEAGAIWVMPKKTYYKEIVGMVDDGGQPIARTNVGIDGKPEHTILGRKVEFTTNIDPFTTSVTKDTIVAAIFNFADYAVNTNYQMTIKKYIDEDTDDRITKALMLTDGKTVDKNSLVVMKIKNS